MKRWSLPVLALIMLGCTARPGRGPAAGPGHPSAGAPTRSPAAAPAASVPVTDAVLDHGRAAVPVTPADPSRGSPTAPVTIVVWSDLECPHCARASETLARLERTYGPERLRVVWKNDPLPFHPNARPAAEAAMTVFALGGAAAFWRFHDLAFANQTAFTLASFVAWAATAGVDPGFFEEAFMARRQRQKVDDDMAVAARLRVPGTPAFRINGIPLVGAQPVERFQTIIDSQLAAAQALLASGTLAQAIYPTLCNRNAGVEEPPAETAPPTPSASEAEKTWSVPIDRDDPMRGPADALVTLVLWSDLECPFCRRLETTLATLTEKYGSDLRIVWKDFPLPSHRLAQPAAVLTRLASVKQGQDGFWLAHDAIVATGEVLDEAALKAVAARLGLAWFEVEAAVAERRFQATFDRSLALAKQLGVRGTPCAFVNGRRIEGARPVESYVALIDAQLSRARDLLEAGQERAHLYALLTGTPEIPDELPRVSVAAPTRDNPTRGKRKAPVTMQMFGDFQCPQCLRVVPKLAEIEKKFAGRVRLVWRNHPLVFHEDAALAAEAAQEVFVQKGAAAFWRYHELLFAAQDEGGLGQGNLEKLARQVGVDGKRFRAALRSHRHRRVIERDIEAAVQAEIAEVPAVLINGYLVTGVEPLEVYERAVTRALAEAEPAP
jgi:protein-disulfide isomerase